jgi:DNA replicative helicase MCM subunit Mcm2 (Cdc46/Mcm family)
MPEAWNEDMSVIGMEDNDGRLSPENELTQYFLLNRSDELIDAFQSNEFKVDVNENDIINIILNEHMDSFRSIIRDAVVKSIVMINVDDSNYLELTRQARIIMNRLKLELIFPINLNIKGLNAQEHEGSLVTFESKVSNWAKIRTVTKTAFYKCPDCEDIITRKFVPKIRDKCNACNIAYEFYKPDESEDTRRIVLREIVDDFSDGELPYTVSSDIYGHIVKEVNLSDKLIVTGVFRSVPLSKEDGKISRQFIPTIQVICVRNMDDVQGSKMPSDELVEKFKVLEEKGQLVKSVIDGFAYNIYEKRSEKKAILCSLIGSKWIGQVGKGNPPMIHILFVGDPDTYKSTIMKYTVNVSDNCVLADSTTVSNAGIKAIAVKMDDGRWSIRAGLLPEYNGGVVFLDEFGDLKEDIYADLKAPMIDGRVSKHVAGEDFNAQAETGILASMNPVEGVYDDNKTIYENLARLEKPLITRFDIIFKFSKSSPDYDSGKIREHFKKCDIHGKPEEYLTDNEIKLFINYVKDIDPKVTEEAIDTSNKFFEELEKKGGEKSGTETRTENAVMKFAVAISKWHMSKEVNKSHVVEALELFSSGMKTLGVNFQEGEMVTERTLKKTKDGRMEAIRLAYDSCKDEFGYVFPDELIEKVMTYKVFGNEGQIKTQLETMRLDSRLSEKNNMYKISWSM